MWVHTCPPAVLIFAFLCKVEFKDSWCLVSEALMLNLPATVMDAKSSVQCSVQQQRFDRDGCGSRYQHANDTIFCVNFHQHALSCSVPVCLLSVVLQLDYKMHEIRETVTLSTVAPLRHSLHQAHLQLFNG